MGCIDDLRMMNDVTINYLTQKNLSYERNNIIKKILEDEACFFKMEKSDACMILQDIGVNKEKLVEIFNLVTSSDEFYILKNSGKILENDKELKIKY